MKAEKINQVGCNSNFKKPIDFSLSSPDIVSIGENPSSRNKISNLSSLKAAAKIVDSIAGLEEVREKWSFKTGSYVYSSPCLGPDGTLYVGSDDKKVYAIDTKTGKEKWSFKTGGAVSPSPCLGPDDTLYVGSYDNKAYALEWKTKDRIIEEAIKEQEVKKTEENNKIIKSNKTVKIGKVTLDINQRYRKI